jgi:hypothetical protein
MKMQLVGDVRMVMVFDTAGIRSRCLRVMMTMMMMMMMMIIIIIIIIAIGRKRLADCMELSTS